MKTIAGFIGLAFLHLIVACSSMAPRWQPTAVTDFKSVAGKWEGFLTSEDPRTLNYDRATLVIDDTGGCETTITRTITKMPVSYHTFDVFAEKAQLVLTDDKLSARFEKGGRMTAQLDVDPAGGERSSKPRVKIVKGSSIPPISNAPETLPPQNDDPLPYIIHSMNDRFSVA